jgi:hypothetical protein
MRRRRGGLEGFSHTVREEKGRRKKEQEEREGEWKEGRKCVSMLTKLNKKINTNFLFILGEEVKKRKMWKQSKYESKREI